MVFPGGVFSDKIEIEALSNLCISEVKQEFPLKEKLLHSMNINLKNPKIPVPYSALLKAFP